MREGRRPPRGPLRQGASGYPLGPGFWVDGRPVVLVRPKQAGPSGPMRSASGSTYVAGARARVARAGRIYVEGKHDAELVEKVWGHDLRVEGVVVEPLHGVDDLPGDREGVPARPRDGGSACWSTTWCGARRSRGSPSRSPASTPSSSATPSSTSGRRSSRQVVGIQAWPVIPKGQPWKEGVCTALGWEDDTGYVWAQRILARVTSFTDLEPELLGRVEELIDFVTTD